MVNQKRVSLWYSIAVTVLDVPEGISVQMPADAELVRAPSPTAQSVVRTSERTTRDKAVPPGG